MIELRLSLEALGNVCFGYSPVGEVAASLRSMRHPVAGAVLRPWLDEVSPGLAHSDLELMRLAVPDGDLAPDFLYPTSTDPGVGLEEQLAVVIAAPLDDYRRDLADVWAGRSAPAGLAELVTATGRRLLVEAIRRYWDHAVGPYWPRIRAAVDHEVSSRAAQVLTDGLYGMFADLHPELSVCDGVLRIDKPHQPGCVLAQPRITLVPSVFVWPQLLVWHSSPAAFALQYPARGFGRVWQALDTFDDALAGLLGGTRARILRALAVPHSTTQLARALGQSPAGISAHLTTLRRNGLATAVRTGRSVVYRQTPLAASIIRAGGGQQAGDTA